jgi:hypothetical protein
MLFMKPGKAYNSFRAFKLERRVADASGGFETADNASETVETGI